MNKTYYQILPRPKPGLTMVKVDARTGEQYDAIALDGKFDDKRTAEKWCAVLNQVGLRKYRVLRRQN